MTLKRVMRTALALILAFSCLLCVACSTPAVAMEVGGKVYEMGDYLAYAFGTATADYNSYIYLSYYGEQALSMDFTYGEGDDQQDVSLKEYLILSTRDMMIRQKALEDMLAENKIEWDEELLKAAEDDLKELKPDSFINRGFTNERYVNMYKAFQLNEASLFDGLYNKGGVREVAETEIRKFFDENYLSYYMFEVSLVDDEKAALKDEIIKDYQERFDAYLETFNKSEKKIEDFQKIYRQFLADTAEEEEKDEDTQEDDKTEKATTETEADHDHDHDHDEEETTDSDKKEEEQTAERQDVVKVADGVDEELVKAVEKITEGEAKVVTYKKGGTTNTLAFIFRMDPEAERGQDEDKKDIDYYEETRDQTLQHMKYEEFDKEVKERMETLKKDAVINERALKAVDFIDLLF